MLTSSSTPTSTIHTSLSSPRCEALLNNDLSTARTLLSAKDDSFHLVGRGITAFLAAILSREDEELKRATETLAKAEATASAEASAKRPKGEVQVFPVGTEFKVHRCCPFLSFPSSY